MPRSNSLERDGEEGAGRLPRALFYPEFPALPIPLPPTSNTDGEMVYEG
jgi:hypothetical protein